MYIARYYEVNRVLFHVQLRLIRANWKTEYDMNRQKY